MVAIVIPITDTKGYINREDLDNLLSDIEPHKDKFEAVITLYDSCNWDFVMDMRQKYPFQKPIWNTGRALNFTANSNIGLRFVHQQGWDVILVNQDCRLPDASALLNLKGEGISSAKSFPDKLIKYLGDFSRERIVGHFPFYCTYIPTTVMDKIGYLDETMVKTHSDNDYCLRALLARFPVELVNCNIHHRGSHIDNSPGWESASGCYNEEDLSLSSGQYRSKWGFPNDPDDAIIKRVLENYVWEDRFKCV